MAKDLKGEVFESLNSAIDNGYDLDEWPAESIAIDLAEYDRSMEKYSTEELLPHVREWLSTRK